VIRISFALPVLLGLSAPLVAQPGAHHTASGTTAVSASQAIEATGAGNATPLQSSFVVQAEVSQAAADKAQAAEVITLTSGAGHAAWNYGQGGLARNNNQITSYRSFVALPGAADGWVDNILFSHETNDHINTHGVELDYDMISPNRFGVQEGAAGLGGGIDATGHTFADGATYGITITGVSAHGGTINAGMLVARAGSHLLAGRGYACSAFAIISCFEDDGTSRYAFYDGGSHLLGINTEHAVYSDSTALSMGNGQRIASLSDDGQRHTIARLSGGNLLLGDAGLSNIVAFQSLLPQNLDLALGKPDLPWKMLFTRGMILSSAPPVSSSSACSKGAVQWDSSYFYICVAPNHWRRTTLTDF